MARRVAIAWALALAVAAAASAQSGSSGTSAGQSTTATQPPSSSTPAAEETRPATTTFFGDTGVWFVPTGEILASGKWSVSGYRRGTNFIQGYTNIGDFAGTVGYGIKDRAEIFGSFLFHTRIDRDVKPLFVQDANFGGVLDRYPRVNQAWTGDNVGDFYVGAKINLWSEYRQNPLAIAVRGIVKLPTAKDSVGNGTGKADFSIDGIISKEAAKLVETAGYAGWEFRGKPDGFDAPSGAFHYGVGVTFPSRNFLRVFGELNGTVPNQDTITMASATAIRATDGTFPPLISATENIHRATIGLTVQAKNGFFAGIGGSWNVPTRARNPAFTDDDQPGDHSDRQQDRDRHGEHPRDAAAGQAVHVRRRALRLRSLHAASRSDARARRSGDGDARDADAAADHRGSHLQHRDGRIQPRARRPARERGKGLPDEPRRHGGSSPDDQLRRRAPEVRQLARRDAAAEPSRGIGGALAVKRTRFGTRDLGFEDESRTSDSESRQLCVLFTCI